MHEGAARTGGWRPARPAAVAAGAFLLWRGLFGRAPGGFALALLGAYVLWRALGRDARVGAAGGRRRRGPPEVVEVKSPAELEPGIVSASPTPTSPGT
jgi:hypothetical protein